MNVKNCYESRLIMEVAEAPYFHVRDSSEFPQVQQGNMRYTNWVVMGPLTIHDLLYNSVFKFAIINMQRENSPLLKNSWKSKIMHKCNNVTRWGVGWCYVIQAWLIDYIILSLMDHRHHHRRKIFNMFSIQLWIRTSFSIFPTLL